MPNKIDSTDESYELTIENKEIYLQANEYSGIVRGLATVSYLI